MTSQPPCPKTDRTADFYSVKKFLRQPQDLGSDFFPLFPELQQCAFQIQRLNAWTNRYQAEFYAGATNQVIRAWIRNNFSESPEEITGIMYTLLCYMPISG